MYIPRRQPRSGNIYFKSVVKSFIEKAYYEQFLFHKQFIFQHIFQEDIQGVEAYFKSAVKSIRNEYDRVTCDEESIRCDPREESDGKITVACTCQFLGKDDVLITLRV